MNKESRDVQEVLRTNKRCPKCGAELHVVVTYFLGEFTTPKFPYYCPNYRIKCSNSECDILSETFFSVSEMEDAWRLKILDE